MNKLLLLLFVLFFMFTNFVSRGIGPDSDNGVLTKEAREAKARAFLAEEAMVGAMYHYTKLFTRMTGKQPTHMNLVESLKIKNSDGSKNSEIVIALNLLIIEKQKDKALVPEIIECYNRNSDWLIRVLCSEMLLDLDEEQGGDLAKKIIDDPQLDVDAKLRMSRRLVERGKLFAYPVLREGLTTANNAILREEYATTNNPVLRERLASINKYHMRIVMELLEAYRPYDGKVWDEKTGEKIDIAQLLKDLSIKFSTNKTDVSVGVIGAASQLITNQTAVVLPGSGKTNDRGNTGNAGKPSKE